MPKIVKATVSFTVLLPENELSDFMDASIDAILEETDTGGWISGNVNKSKAVNVPPSQLASELKEIGNDGTFFDVGYEDDAPTP